MARKIPVGEAFDLEVDTPETNIKWKPGLPHPGPVDLGDAGPKYNRSSFAGPTRPAGFATAPASPVAEALATEKRGGLGGARNTVAKMILPGAVGALGMRALNSIAGARPNDGAIAPQGAGQIPIDPGLRAPAAVEGNLLRDTEVGRNFGNVVNALGPMGGAVARGAQSLFRAGSAADRAAVVGAGLAQGAAAANAQPVPGALQLPEPPTLRTPTGAGGGRGFVNPTAAQSAERAAAAGAAPTTPIVNPNDFSAVSNLGDTQLGLERIQRANAIDAQTRKMQMGLMDQNDPDFYITGAGAQPRGPMSLGGESYQRGIERQNAETTANSLRADARMASGRRAGALLASADRVLDRYDAGLDRASREGIEAARDQTAREGQRQQAKTANQGLRIAEMRDATDRRGQDLEYGAKTQAGKLAAAEAARKQANDDRQYQLDVAKFGVDQADKNRTARAAEQAAVDKNLESMFRKRDDKGNDVADTERIGSYKRAVETSLAALIKRHEATGRPENLAAAKRLSERGLAGLDASDHDHLRRLFAVRDRVMQSKGLLPGQASGVLSDNLFDYEQIGREDRTFGGDRIKMKAGEISLNDLRYTEPANRFLPDLFKQETYDLTRGLK